jgi:hypothetical protein
LRDLPLAEKYRLRETAEPDENAAALARFLGVSLDKAREITATDYLFVD